MRGKRKTILEYVVLVVVAAVLALVVNKKIIVNAEVPSGSMEPTVMTGDRILVSRLSYRFGEVKRGDVVMFYYPDNEEEQWLKRVIGMPGETLEIREGYVYIDGADRPLEEIYLEKEQHGDYGPYEIPEDAYFVMGDNRGNSLDSRFWNNTCVKKEKIIGKAVLVYYPKLSRLGK